MRISPSPVHWHRSSTVYGSGSPFATIERQSEPDHDGFCELDIAFNAEFHALAWACAGGADVIIRNPPELRERIIQQAGVLLAHYGQAT